MGVQTLEENYNDITMSQYWNVQALAANSQIHLPVRERAAILMRVNETYSYIYFIYK